MKNFYLFIVFFCCLLRGVALADSLQFSHHTIENGLPHNLVNSFIQDKNGFIWIATQNGVARFDGYTFKTYKTDAKNFCGLLSSNIKAFVIDKQERFWIGTTGGGLHQYDYSQDKFISFSDLFKQSNITNFQDVYALTSSADGSLWIGTYGGGLIHFNPKTQKIEQFRHNAYDTCSLASNDIRCLLYDSFGRLWIGTDGGGLDLFSPNNKRFIHYKAGRSPLSLRNNVVMSLFEDSDKDIWVGTYGAGIHKISKTGLAVVQRFESDNQLITQSIIWSITETEKDKIWFSTRGNGIIIYDKKRNEWQNITHSVGNKTSVSSNLVLDVFRDQSGVIWVATENAGISCLNLYQNKFKSAAPCRHICAVLKRNNVFAITKDQDGEFWIGVANNGIYQYKPSKNNVSTIPGRTLKGEINLNTVFAIVSDKEGTLWFGTDGHGLESYNPRTKKCQRYVHNSSDNTSLSNNAVHSLLVAQNGYIWVGTYGGGLCRLDPKTGIFKRYTIDSEIMKNVVLTLFEDNHGQIWLGTGDKGLARLNSDDSFTFYQANPQSKGTISNNRVWSIAQTSNKKYLWLGTDGGGLCCLDLTTDYFTNWTIKDGLPNDVVNSLLIDKRDNIWIGTLLGLARFTPNTNSFDVFTQYDGLINNQFNPNASFCNSDGKIIFGGIDGIDSFYPDSISYSKFAPNVVLTNLSVGNIPVEVNEIVKGKVLLTKAITELADVSFNYTHTIISFEFAALDYRSPNSIRYAYQLEGFDEDWVETSSARRYVTYTQLPAGHYTLKIKATNSDGVWNEKITRLSIEVTPPFWKATWFIVLMILCFSLMVYLVFRLRVLQLKIAKRKLEQAVAKQTEELIQQSGQILLQSEEILDQKERLEKQHEELEEHRRNLEIMVSIRTDELRQALDRANEADMLKTAFLTNMSHEIRTPMNTIMGFADMLSINTLSDEKRHRYVAQIYKNGETLVRIIDDIIDIAKIQTGQIKLSKKTTNISHVLRNAHIYIEDAVTKQNKPITVHLLADETLDNITTYTDEFRVMQVLINLLSNSEKYTDKGTIEFGVEIITDDTEQSIRFFVADTGRGITDEQSSYVFKSFSKVNSRERHYSGAGLGLCIAQNVVELLGGKIWFEPNQPQGTRFYFTIPISYKNDDTDIKRINWKCKKILIAEDDELSYLVLKELLDFEGVEFLWAQNGIEAVELFNMHTPILVFMDLRMPEMDGYQALAAIRQQNETVPVIAQSAFALDGERAKIIEVGFSDLLSKPIVSSTLYLLLLEIFADEVRRATGNQNSYLDMSI